MKSSWLAVGLSLLAVALLTFFLLWEGKNEPAAGEGGPLVLYCAAGIRPPVEAVIRRYRTEYGVEVIADYGGSGQLLSTLRIEKERPRADLFLAGDESYAVEARRLELAAESILVARMRPVIAVRKGSGKKVEAVDDLWRGDLKVVLANPEFAAIGQVTRKLLEEAGKWRELQSRTQGLRAAVSLVGTVTEVANNLKLGAADAGIVWDTTLKEYPELEMVEDKLLARGIQDVTIAVVQGTRRPAAALRFARYLAARDKGLEEFKRSGWETADGDEWAEQPELVVYSGALNRPAIEKTVAEFEVREGARVTIKYAGCGILVADIKAIAKGEDPAAFPDAYFACDRAFVPPVAEQFLQPVEVSETDVVLLVPKGNPKGIRTLADLARPGLRVAMANEEHSALGALAKRLLEAEGLYEAVKKNVTYQAPTADQLVLRMLAGGAGTGGSLSEDAAIVYEANCSKARESLDVVHLDAAGARGATAVQPFAIARSSKHKFLAERLRAAIVSGVSRQRFESAGFRWRAGSE